MFGAGTILKKTICMKCPSNCQICQINNSFPECLKCDVGYYVNSLACTKCSDQCLNCESLPSNCNGCRFSKNNETGLCELCESQPGYYSDFKNNKCTTICGDSFKSSNEECDDGNKIDGDGCDKYCRKEIHYLCKDGICKGLLIIKTILFRNILNQLYWFKVNQSSIIISDNFNQAMIKNQKQFQISTLINFFNFTYLKGIQNKIFIIPTLLVRIWTHMKIISQSLLLKQILRLTKVHQMKFY